MRTFLIILAIAIIGIAIFVFFKSGKFSKDAIMTKRVMLTTNDGVKIVGEYSGKEGESAVLMLHMMPAAKESWREFSVKLTKRGLQVLAIDLRGHGESNGGPKGYKNFSDQEHQASIKDVEAASEFLKSKGAASISIAGASIGANLALQYASEHGDIQKIILLSPGLDYHGIMTAPRAEKLHEGQSVYFAAALDDTYSADTVRLLYEKTPSSVEKEIKIFERAGHGTNIFEKEPAFMDELIEWILLTK